MHPHARTLTVIYRQEYRWSLVSGPASTVWYSIWITGLRTRLLSRLLICIIYRHARPDLKLKITYRGMCLATLKTLFLFCILLSSSSHYHLFLVYPHEPHFSHQPFHFHLIIDSAISSVQFIFHACIALSDLVNVAHLAVDHCPLLSFILFSSYLSPRCTHIHTRTILTYHPFLDIP